MKNIDLICVGKLKLDCYKNLEKYIFKNIKKYNINIIEIEDEKNIDIQRQANVEKIKNIEGKKILSKIKKSNYVITFEIQAKKQKYKNLKDIAENIEKDITIIIGGSVGLSSEVSKISNMKISLSNMTFPHQLVRLVVLEQFMEG